MLTIVKYSCMLAASTIWQIQVKSARRLYSLWIERIHSFIQIKNSCKLIIIISWTMVHTVYYTPSRQMGKKNSINFFSITIFKVIEKKTGVTLCAHFSYNVLDKKCSRNDFNLTCALFVKYFNNLPNDETRHFL